MGLPSISIYNNWDSTIGHGDVPASADLPPGFICVIANYFLLLGLGSSEAVTKERHLEREPYCYSDGAILEQFIRENHWYLKGKGPVQSQYIVPLVHQVVVLWRPMLHSIWLGPSLLSFSATLRLPVRKQTGPPALSEIKK